MAKERVLWGAERCGGSWGLLPGHELMTSGVSQTGASVKFPFHLPRNPQEPQTLECHHFQRVRLTETKYVVGPHSEEVAEGDLELGTCQNV